MKKILQAIWEYIKSIDKLLILICLSLSCFSCIILYSIYVNGFSNSRVLTMQVICIGLGFVAMIVTSLFDYSLVEKLWWLLALVSIGLVLMCYIPGIGFTPEGSDDQAWIRVGSFSFQPSEVLKLAFIYTFSLHLSKVKDEMNKFKNFCLLCLHGAVPIGLIVLQGDLGSALVFVAIFLVLMFVGGLSWKFIIIGIVAMAVITPTVWEFLPSYLQRRFEVAHNPALDKLGDGYQQYQGLVGLGSGKMFGRGLFSEGLINIPESYNDFIFSYIGQTLGFVGCVGVSVGLTLLCVKILLSSVKAKDEFGKYICCGIFSIICFQSVINIGMVLCFIPVIGITLPFTSGGGTSLVMSFIGIGMVLGVYRQSKNDSLFVD